MICTTCKKEITESNSYILKNGKISKSCNACMAIARKYYNNNRGKVLKSKKEYFNKNKKIICEKSIKHYYDNKEEILQNKKQYEILHKEDIKIYRKKNYIKNISYILCKNAEKRAKKLNIKFCIEKSDIFIKDCQCCGIEIKPNINGNHFNETSPTIDRIIPELGYSKDNIKVVCFKCNMIKGNGSIEDHKRIINYINSPEIYKEQNDSIRLCSSKEDILYSKAKNRAKTKHIDFSIEKYNIFIPKICQVCKIEICQNNNKVQNNSPSVDRVNPTLGYIKNNIAVICYRCNNIKSNGNVEDHKRIVDYIKLAVHLERDH